MSDVNICHTGPIARDNLLRRVARRDAVERVQRRLIAPPAVLADHVTHSSQAEAGIPVRVRRDVGQEGPGLVVIARVDGAVDEYLERVADDLLQVDLGGRRGLPVRGARARARRRRLVRVGDPVRDRLPPRPGAALVDPVALRIRQPVAPFVHDDARDGDVGLLHLEPRHAGRGVRVHDARRTRQARDRVQVDLGERPVVVG